ERDLPTDDRARPVRDLRPRVVALEHGQAVANRPERVAQLVGEDREELVLAAVHLAQRALGPFAQLLAGLSLPDVLQGQQQAALAWRRVRPVMARSLLLLFGAEGASRGGGGWARGGGGGGVGLRAGGGGAGGGPSRGSWGRVG